MRKYLDIPLTLIVTLILTIAMLWPMNQPPPTPEGSDKLLHLAAFAALAFPLTRTSRVSLLLIFMGACVFGGLIEIIQPTFDRSADLNDWIADILGVILGIALGLIYRQVRKH
jgi:VanZ family protein